MDGLSIIVPTLNERGNMETLLRGISLAMRGFKNYEILVIDDNSQDGTLETVRQFNSRKIKPFVRKNQRGLSTAIMFGIKKSKYDIICVMDADLLHQPRFIPKMFSKIRENNADIILGSRFANGSKLVNLSWYRIGLSRICVKFLRFMFPKLSKTTDPLSGFFMLRKSLLKGLKLKGLGFKILLDILIKGNYKVIETPAVFRGRIYGKSKLDWREYFVFAKLVAHLFLFQVTSFFK